MFVCRSAPFSSPTTLSIISALSNAKKYQHIHCLRNVIGQCGQYYKLESWVRRESEMEIFWQIAVWRSVFFFIRPVSWAKKII